MNEWERLYIRRVQDRRIINRQLTVNIKRKEIYPIASRYDISIPVTTSCLHKHTPRVSWTYSISGPYIESLYIIRLLKKKEKKRKEIERTFLALPYPYVVLRFDPKRESNDVEIHDPSSWESFLSRVGRKLLRKERVSSHSHGLRTRCRARLEDRRLYGLK